MAKRKRQRVKASRKPASLSDLAVGPSVGKPVDLKAFAEKHNVRVDSLRTVVRDLTRGILRKGSGLKFNTERGQLRRLA